MPRLIAVLLTLLPALATAGPWTARATWDPVRGADSYRVQWWVGDGARITIGTSETTAEWPIPAGAVGELLNARVRSCVAGAGCGPWGEPVSVRLLPAPQNLRIEIFWRSSP